jgi:hypothetical protein
VVPSVDVWWMHLRSSVAKDGRTALDTLLVSTMWHLWLEQNARRFTMEKMTTTKLAGLIPIIVEKKDIIFFEPG